MRPRDVAAVLSRAIQAREPVLLVGPPGVGKSDLVRAAADAAQMDIILSHLSVWEATDARGLPWPDQTAGVARWLPYGDLARACRAETPTVWFLDDLGQAAGAVQAATMQLLLARRVGDDHVLSPHVTFVAATNRRQDRAGVTGLLAPVVSRFSLVLDLEPHLDDWCEWAVGASIRPEVIAYLRLRPEVLCQPDPAAAAEMRQAPSPRTWAAASRVLGLIEGLPAGVQADALSGVVGPSAAAEFLGFLRVYAQMAGVVDRVLLDPEQAPIPTEPSARYAVSSALVARATLAVWPRIARYAERLGEAGAGEYAVFLLRDLTRRHTEILATPEWIRVMAGELGALVFSRTGTTR